MGPDRPLSTANNKGSIFSALSDTFGGNASNLYNEPVSILPVEFEKTSSTSTTPELPAKFYFGQNVGKMQTSVALSDVSSNNSAISLRVDLGTQTNRQHQISLIVLYDALITIDLFSKQASVRV